MKNRRMNIRLYEVSEPLQDIRSIGSDISDIEFWKCIVDDINGLFDIVVFTDWQRERMNLDFDKMSHTLKLITDNADGDPTQYQYDLVTKAVTTILSQFFARIKRMRGISGVGFTLRHCSIQPDGSAYLELEFTTSRSISDDADAHVRILARKVIDIYAKTFNSN